MAITVPIILVVTGVVPYFPQTPVSYMMFPTLPDSMLNFKFDLSFKPETPDGKCFFFFFLLFGCAENFCFVSGLILFNGDKQTSDFVSVGLTNGIVEFKFDVGAGPVVIKNDRPIRLGQWHTVNVTRRLKTGNKFS